MVAEVVVILHGAVGDGDGVVDAVGAQQVTGGDTEVVVGGAVVGVAPLEYRVPPGGVQPAGVPVQPDQVPGVALPIGLAADVGAGDAQLGEKVLGGLGVAAA